MATKKTYEERTKKAFELEKDGEIDKAIYQLKTAVENYPEESKEDEIELDIARLESLDSKDFKPSDKVDFELYHTINYKDGMIGPGIVKLPYEMKIVFENETMKKIGKCLV